MNKKGQAILEYGLIISIVVAALTAMQAYIKRGIQGQIKVSCDQLGQQKDGTTPIFNPQTQSFQLYSETASKSQPVQGSGKPYTRRLSSKPGQGQTVEFNEETANRTPDGRPEIYYQGMIEE